MVVDPSVWINFLNGREDDKVQVLLHHDAPAAVVAGDLILMEMLQGARSEERAAVLAGRLRRFKLAPMLKSGARPQIRLELQNTTPKRTCSPSINGRNHWTSCIEHDLPLPHMDRDFDIMQSHPGLQCLYVARHFSLTPGPPPPSALPPAVRAPGRPSGR